MSLSYNMERLYSRLAGGCGLCLVGDSQTGPWNTRLTYGLFNNIPSSDFLLSGASWEARTGGDGIQTLTVAQPTNSVVSKTDPNISAPPYTVFSGSITQGVAFQHRQEYTFAGNVADSSVISSFRFTTSGSGRSIWTQPEFLGDVNFTYRLIYYKHTGAPVSMDYASVGTDSAVTGSAIDTAAAENYGWVDVVAPKVAAVTNHSAIFGIDWKTGSKGYDETGTGFSIVGCQAYAPGIDGVRMCANSFGGAAMTAYADTGKCSDANLINYCLAYRVDTIVVIATDEVSDSAYTTSLKNLADRYIVAINAARAIDSTIQSPLICVTSMWEVPSTFPLVNGQRTAIETLAQNNDYCYINFYDLVLRNEGARSGWFATLSGTPGADTDVHPSILGADTFGKIFWQEIIDAGYLSSDLIWESSTSLGARIHRVHKK